MDQAIDTRGLALPARLATGVDKLFARQLGVGSSARGIVEKMYGSTIVYGHLARTTAPAIRTACTELGFDPVQADVDDLAELLPRIHPDTPICDRCGELPLTSAGGRVAALDSGAACPFCQAGRFLIVPQKLRAMSWATGALVEPSVREDLRSRPGLRIPLDDRSIRDWAGWVDARLDAALIRRELPLASFLAFMNLRRRALAKIEDATELLHEPARFGLAADPALEQALVEAQVFVADREITNLEGSPFLPDGRRKDAFPRAFIGGRTYMIEGLIGRGDEHDVLRARWDVRSTEVVIIKAARGAHRSEDEALNLRRLASSTAQGHELYATLVPELVHDGMMRMHDGSECWALVLRDKNQFDYTLADVLHEYPEGADVETMVWMYNRTLSLLDWVHRSHVVHGAVEPKHLLIHARNHGVILLDFGTAGRDGPMGLLKAGDVASAARSMIAVLGGDPRTASTPSRVPEPLRDLLREHAESPPASAIDAQRAFGELCGSLFGAKRYHPFFMPRRRT